MAMYRFQVSSTGASLSAERRFPGDLPVLQLKGKLELIVGTPAAFQHLELYDDNGQRVSVLEDDKTLSEYPVQDGMRIHVIDTDPNKTAAQLTDTSGVEKKEMAEDDYDKREDSVRAFKRRMKLGRFADEASEEDTLAAERSLIEKMKVGDRCQVAVQNQPDRRGTVLFLGETQFKPGCIWVGVRFDLPQGKNDGSVGGVRYFECQPKYGAFVRPNSVTVGDFPEESFGISDDEL